MSALCPKVHEAVDAAFERAFESVEPFLNKTGELGGVTPYSEVGLFMLDEELHGICALHPNLMWCMAGVTSGTLACHRCQSLHAERSMRRLTTWPPS